MRIIINIHFYSDKVLNPVRINYKFLFAALLLLIQTNTFAQQLISPTGGEGGNATYSLSWSIGELAVNTGSNGTLTGTQGYQQPVEINHINQVPVANAGADQTVDEGDLVSLDGSLSADFEQDGLSYQWTCLNGIVLDDPTAVQPTFTAPEANTDTIFIFTLVVNDGVVNSQQDTVVITVRNISTDLQVSNTTLTDAEMDCFNAYNTITVAGDETSVVLSSGSSANFIAGQSICFLPGFHAHAGSYAHGYITTTGSFCDDLPQAIVAAPEPVAEKSIMPEQQPSGPQEIVEQSIVVYPNPNNGRFTIKLNNIDSETRVLMYSAVGQKVYDVTMTEQLHSVELPNVQRGIYFIKAINNQKQFDQKIVIQ
ncbi:MAG: T9SS type A sorting domain-containing protein [Prolixibacteraceae bacterium]|jgi:hypothetical protein|nr:T9SS type A sorting domain-containing protein [Prolixibacteraceae bacterium]